MADAGVERERSGGGSSALILAQVMLTGGAWEVAWRPYDGEVGAVEVVN